jgi:ABC-2 type transport system permease protein
MISVAFKTLVRREIHRYLKVLFQTIFTPLINSVLYLLIFGVSLGESIKLSSGVTYLAFIIPGLVMMSCLNNAFQNSSSSIVSGKFSGDVEDWKVVPLTSQSIIGALCIGALTRGLLVGSLTLVVGEVFYFFTYNELLILNNSLLFLFFLIVGGLVFSLIGILVAIWAKTFDEMSAIGSLILTPLMFLGGVFFSIKGLSPIWQNISLYNPLL